MNEKDFDPILEELNCGDFARKIYAITALGIIRKPKNADILKDYLGSTEEKVVLTALEALGRLKNPNSLKYVLEILNDHRAHFVENAIKVLEKFPSKDLLEPLLKVLGGDRPSQMQKKLLHLIGTEKNDRVKTIMSGILNKNQDPVLLQEALTYFIRFPSPENHSSIKSHSTSGQWEISLSANIALSRLKDEGALAQIQKMAKSPAHPLRLALIQTLNVNPQIEDRFVFEHLLRDTHPQIKTLALNGLQLFPKEERTSLLKNLVKIEKDVAVKKGLFETIIKEKNPEFLPEFLELLSGTSDDGKKLGRTGLISLGKGILPEILQTYPETSLLVKEQLVMVLGDLGGKEAVAILVECLNSSERWLKINAIEALTKTKDKVYVAKFLEMLKDGNDVWIRATLLSALGQLGNKEHIAVFEENLKNADARVRANALEGMTNLGDATVRKIVEGFLRDPNDRVRVNAAIGLWKLGDREVVAELENLTADRSKWMKASAAFALGEIRAAQATPALLKLLDSTEEVVYRNTIDALGKAGDIRAVIPILREKSRGKIPEDVFAEIIENISQRLS